MEFATRQKIHRFQESILTYWEQYGRHELPWRLTDDPWKLLTAEMLLRKTTSQQALKVYDQLESLSPEDILQMNVSDLEEVLKPLGIYKVRAVQLKTAAHAVVEYGEEIFRLDNLLRSLPGVGRYISNSVRCCAFGHAGAAMDTNMIRVIQRVFNWVSTRKRPREDRMLWDFADSLVPDERCRGFNWGVLDFAAAVCTFRNPKCVDCPIRDICCYYEKIRQQSEASAQN